MPDLTTFDGWLSVVSKKILKKTDLSKEELPDQDYWEHWYGGTSVEAMAMIVYNNYMMYDS
tara:strand:- start:187 stop:369 length:183 start_codon:yes stop_codon:yes gene_type:complete